jgi:hypothetical protein
MDSVNGMVGSYSTFLRTVFVLKGECLNGNCWAMGNLPLAIETREEIVHARESRTEFLWSSLKGAGNIVASLVSGDPPRDYREWITQLVSLIRMVAPDA